MTTGRINQVARPRRDARARRAAVAASPRRAVVSERVGRGGEGSARGARRLPPRAGRGMRPARPPSAFVRWVRERSRRPEGRARRRRQCSARRGGARGPRRCPPRVRPGRRGRPGGGDGDGAMGGAISRGPGYGARATRLGSEGAGLRRCAGEGLARAAGPSRGGGGSGAARGAEATHVRDVGVRPAPPRPPLRGGSFGERALELRRARKDVGDGSSD